MTDDRTPRLRRRKRICRCGKLAHPDHTWCIHCSRKLPPLFVVFWHPCKACGKPDAPFGFNCFPDVPMAQQEWFCHACIPSHLKETKHASTSAAAE